MPMEVMGLMLGEFVDDYTVRMQHRRLCRVVLTHAEEPFSLADQILRVGDAGDLLGKLTGVARLPCAL